MQLNMGGDFVKNFSQNPHTSYVTQIEIVKITFIIVIYCCFFVWIDSGLFSNLQSEIQIIKMTAQILHALLSPSPSPLMSGLMPVDTLFRGFLPGELTVIE